MINALTSLIFQYPLYAWMGLGVNEAAKEWRHCVVADPLAVYRDST